ncbi:hypothetical protein C8J56DRAFT_484133 [Mycena floridula]|nr:hypothetical protein C8J56DRAFT_484133 [Mycena floridula]
MDTVSPTSSAYYFPSSTTPSSIIVPPSLPKRAELSPSVLKGHRATGSLSQAHSAQIPRRLSVASIFLSTENKKRSPTKSSYTPLISKKVREGNVLLGTIDTGVYARPHSPTSGIGTPARSRFQNLWQSPTSPRGTARPFKSLRQENRCHHMRHESRCLQMIKPGLYVAFGDDRTAFNSSNKGYIEELRTKGGQEFTHIVELVHSNESRAVLEQRSKSQYLRLALPPTPAFGSHLFEKTLLDRKLSLIHPSVERSLTKPSQFDAEWKAYFLDLDLQTPDTFPHLPVVQLLAARDFLHQSGWRLTSEDSTASIIGPRILITTPRDDTADAMYIVSMFLALETGQKTEMAMRAIYMGLQEHKARSVNIWMDALKGSWQPNLDKIVWM